MRVHSFNDMEGLRIAVEMEKRGGEYYRHAARLSKASEAVELNLYLAADEDRHMAEFQRLYDAALESNEDAYYDEDTSAYLSALAADIVFPGGLMKLGAAKGFDSPRAILEGAIESEKDSILFYNEITGVANDERARQIFSEIARQEQGHLKKLMAMLEQTV